MLPFFLKSILCDVKMRSVAVNHRVTTRKCGYKATTLGDRSFPWKLEVPELAQKTLFLVKNGHLLRKTTAILFSLRASWIECENKILFIPKWQRISFLWQILRPGRRTYYVHRVFSRLKRKTRLLFGRTFRLSPIFVDGHPARVAIQTAICAILFYASLRVSKACMRKSSILSGALFSENGKRIF